MEIAIVILLIVLIIGVGILIFTRPNLEKKISDENAQNRKEQNETIDRTRDSLLQQIVLNHQGQQQQLTLFGQQIGHLTELNQKKLDEVRTTVEERLKNLTEDNHKQLDEMRTTVDKKLQTTLEERLKTSFGLVSQQLLAVQKGLGEMQTLAGGVGDLKRILTNVKSRGTWGEFILGNILAEILTPEQYIPNFSPKKNNDKVEFAVRFPGQFPEDIPLYLPIDAKFPKEDYERLVNAAENADTEGIEKSRKALLSALLKSAKDINNKYIAPPTTTPFAIMFVPTEGLYAEILREPGFHDQLQHLNIIPAGPTTLTAILNSICMGFTTLKIEKRAHEIGQILVAVKQEFSKFDETLNLVRKQLQNAHDNLGKTLKSSERLQGKINAVDTDEKSTEKMPTIDVSNDEISTES